MVRWLCTLCLVGGIVSLTVACGSAMPISTDQPIVAGSSPSSNPTSVAVNATGTPTATTTSPTAVSSTGPIRTPEKAAARALALDRENGPWSGKDVRVSHVEWMTLGEAWALASHLAPPPPEDPSTVVWWVDFAGTFPIPSCPAPPPGTPTDNCGFSSAAVVMLAASDGHAIHGFLGARDVPPDSTSISHRIPADARLRTPGDAIDDGFQTIPGKDGNLPTLDSLRLMTYQQWLDEQTWLNNGEHSLANRMYANALIWQVEFSDADYTPPCSIPGGCHIEHVFVALNSIDGNYVGYWGPGPPSPTYPSATPALATPAFTPTASNAPIHTSWEAEARALNLARSDRLAKRPQVIHVEPLTLGEAGALSGDQLVVGSNDPSAVVWWIDLVDVPQDPNCPAPGLCGVSSSISLVIAANDGHLMLQCLRPPIAPATPAGTVPRSLNATLSNADEAVSAGQQQLEDVGVGNVPLVYLRLLTAQEWLKESNTRGFGPRQHPTPNTPVWEMAFTKQLACPTLALCPIEHVFVALNAMDGSRLGLWNSALPNPWAGSDAAQPSSSVANTTTNPPLPNVLTDHNSSGEHVYLMEIDDVPLMSVADAMAIVAQQVPWGNGGTFEGKPVTVNAWYGTVSIGNPGPNGTWGGDTNIPLPSGGILPNLRGRTMWILDYGNVPGMIASVCPGCAPPPVYDHDVYAVDVQSRAVLWWASYESH